MTIWILDPLTQSELSAARRLTPSPAAVAEWQAASQLTPAAEGGRIRSRSGTTAELEISGILSERPSLLAALLGGGGTTYRGIRAALADIDSDSSVSDLVIRIASPGGAVDGLFETIDAIRAFSKPIRVMASQACSAAYALAVAPAGPITASSVGSSFGSVGVAASFYIDDQQVDIASTNAPNKRPDVTTEAGKAVVREHLDALHGLLVDAIARGRKTSADRVNAEFGRGATLLAGKAKLVGMIDSVVEGGTRKTARGTATGAAPASSASDPAAWSVIAAAYEQSRMVPSPEVQAKIDRHAPLAAHAPPSAPRAALSAASEAEGWRVVQAVYAQSGKPMPEAVAAQVRQHVPPATHDPPSPPRTALSAATEAEGWAVVEEVYRQTRRPMPADIAAQVAQARAR